MTYHSIAISGPVAAGSSTAAKTLSQKLNLEHHSAGDFFRKYMLEKNIPLYAKEQIPDDVEREVDEKLTRLVASEKPVVIEGLYIGYFTRNIPHVLRVLLTADEDVRIQRAIDRIHTHKETAENIKKRDRAHDLKFRKLYANENFLDPKFFDLVINTTNIPPEKVVEKIIDRFVGK